MNNSLCTQCKKKWTNEKDDTPVTCKFCHPFIKITHCHMFIDKDEDEVIQ